MKICLYGASSDEIAPVYIRQTELLGRKMGERGHALIFGGGAAGLMGAAARGMTEAGGEIIGVAPTFFNVDGVLYPHCTDFIYTETMRERKFEMEQRADAFIIAPGGIGTFEEFFEVLTLKQLGRHNKPIAVFNVDGYYDDMLALIEKAIEGNFMKDACRALMHAFSDADAMLGYVETCDTTTMLPEQTKFL
ncbi:MAG: TIGR00730 family Rossman fold protein [Clostridia bacterium]|nr:TIGR00730 family Rossman fold protein [Clostridia bacterium]